MVLFKDLAAWFVWRKSEYRANEDGIEKLRRIIVAIFNKRVQLLRFRSSFDDHFEDERQISKSSLCCHHDHISLTFGNAIEYD